MPGAIHVSQATYELLRDEDWTPTGGIEVKGKGLMQVRARATGRGVLDAGGRVAVCGRGHEGSILYPGPKSKSCSSPTRLLYRTAQIPQSCGCLSIDKAVRTHHSFCCWLLRASTYTAHCRLEDTVIAAIVAVVDAAAGSGSADLRVAPASGLGGVAQGHTGGDGADEEHRCRPDAQPDVSADY